MECQRFFYVNSNYVKTILNRLDWGEDGIWPAVAGGLHDWIKTKV